MELYYVCIATRRHKYRKFHEKSIDCFISCVRAITISHLLCNNILDIDIMTLASRQRLMARCLRFFDDFLYMAL